MTEPGRPHDDLRERILSAATELLSREGRGGLTTRAVAAAAGVQAPTLYRLFGDKETLLDAVAEHGFLTYLTHKRGLASAPDPVENLRAGWNQHVEFGLAQPAIFAIMSGDPRTGAESPAVSANLEHLRGKLRAVAVAGRLRVSEEQAADLMRAAGRGVILTLLEMPEERRDLGLSALAREAVMSTITTDAPSVEATGTAGAATTLRALLPGDSSLTAAERALMTEWLERLSRPTPRNS